MKSILTIPMRALRRLYAWTMKWSQSKKAPYALFITAFVESSVFPIPPDALLVPMVTANRNRWFSFALICTLGSVCGAMLGYFIGWAFYESAGRAVVEFYQLQKPMDMIGVKYSQNAFLTVLTAAFTPIPYKVITIGAGLFKIGIPVLLAASLIGRAGRFFLVAGLLRIFGERIANFIEKYFNLCSLAFMVLLIAGFLMLRHVR